MSLNVPLFAKQKVKTGLDEFTKLLNQKNSDEKIEKMLTQWESENPDDVDLYIAYYNYYVNKAKKNGLTDCYEISEDYYGEYLALNDKDGNFVCYELMYTFYDDELSAKAFEYFDKGIELYPNRLDLRFGKTYFCYLREEYDREYSVLEEAVEYGKIINNQWLWSNNEKCEDDFMKETIHEYVSYFFDDINPKKLEYVKKFSELFVKNYLENPVAYNDLGLYYVYKSDFVNVKKYFEEAFKYDDTDLVVAYNLGYINYQLNDIEAEKKYFTFVADANDENYSKLANKMLEKINKL